MPSYQTNSCNHDRLKSLKNGLLEYAVLNMGALFPKGLSRDDIPVFPGGLYEEVLSKSYDMGFRIHCDDLLPCFDIRDKLKWYDYSYFTGKHTLTPSELDSVHSAESRLQRLSVKVFRGEKEYVEAMKIIHKFSETLRYLKIRYVWSSDLISDKAFKKSFEESPPLSLTNLIIGQRRYHFSPRLDPKALKVFYLWESNFYEKELGVFKTFENLQDLSFHNVTLISLDFERLLEDGLMELKKLRRLTFRDVYSDYVSILHSNVPLTVKTIAKLTSNLVNLEWMYTKVRHTSSVEDVDVERKLNVLLVDNLASGRVASEDSEFISQLGKLANKVGDYNSLSGVLTMAEEISCNTRLVSLLEKVNTRILQSSSQPVPADEMARINRLPSVLLEKMFFASNFAPLSRLINNLGLHQFSNDFLLKFATCEFSAVASRASPVTFKILKDFLREKPNTHLARNLRQSALLSDGSL